MKWSLLGLMEGAESLLQQAGFPIIGALPSHQIFSPLHESLSSPNCYAKWDAKWINSQGEVKKIFWLWRVFLWEFAIQKLLITSLQQNFKVKLLNTVKYARAAERLGNW